MQPQKFIIFLAITLIFASNNFSYSQSALEHHTWMDKKTFHPYSRTASVIMGAIQLSGSSDFAKTGRTMTMKFGNGKAVKLTSVEANWRIWDELENTNVTAEIFKINIDPGTLENDNYLCGNPKDDPARYIVFHESYIMTNISLLNVAVFSSKSAPKNIRSSGLCGTFSFEIE